MNKNSKMRKRIYRTLCAMMGFIIVIMAFSVSRIHVNAQSDFSEFPYGYRAKLRELSAAHPNWIFVPLNTNLEWEDVVNAEMVGNRSLVYYNVKDSWKSKEPGDYDPATNTYIGKSGNQWVRASREAVEYHLNPVNYFDDYHMFAFEQLSFNPSVHNVVGVEGIISSSWMSYTPLEDGSGGLYSEVFMQIGGQTGVSPYHLASRVFQEQGPGNFPYSHNNYNPLISGEYGVYNYYNFGASGRTNAEIIANGVIYAQKRGWDTRYKGLLGGAQLIGEGYINKGQDSLYLQKFDVDAAYGLYSHQYMQNIQAPMSESGITYRAYEKINSVNQNFVFKIPVFKNMPGSEPPVSEEKARNFVWRLYVTCLDREPDYDGLMYWTEYLVSREKTATEVAAGVIFSEEFKQKNYCNECYVKHLYRAFLGREYDPDGLANWIYTLETGGTREAVFNGFVLSPEFGAICQDAGIEIGGGTSVPAYGTIPKGPCSGCGKTDGVTQFVWRLYMLCLDREPEYDGLMHHCNLLWNHTISASDDAKGFVFGEEFTNKGYDNVTFVNYLYRIFLDREFDEPGRNDWVSKLEQGASREEVFNGFAGSPEFNALCNKSGIRAFH